MISPHLAHVLFYTDSLFARSPNEILSKKNNNDRIWDNNILKISAERETTKEEDSKYRLREFNYGSFKRSFTLPDNTVAEEIKASFKNGVLSIEIPKVPVQEARKITIK